MAEQDWLTPAAAPAPSPYQNVVAAPAVGPPAYELRPLTLGEILDRTFSLYRSRFWLFAGLASVAAAVELVAAGTGRILLHHFTRNPRTIATAGIVVGYSADLIYFFIYCVTQAATCFAMAEVYLGRPASIASSLRAVRGKWYAWIGIAMWQSWSLAWVPLAFAIPIFVIAGMHLVQQNIAFAVVIFVLVLAMLGGCVFGMIAYIRNSLAIPAKVVEGLGVRKSMRRSKTLAAGAKGRIFVLFLIIWALFLVAGVVAVPIALVMGITPAAPHVLAEVSLLLIGFASRTLVSPVFSIGTCLIYFDQRVRREAFDLEFLLGPEQAAAVPAAQDSAPPYPTPYAAPTAEAEPNAPLL
ncbi:MAG TPA: hypothetical protein VFC39_01955 [Acidobacteriaceae bacterium]|nr:hypothetical protein [Acidobacteriaceae bacterium]